MSSWIKIKGTQTGSFQLGFSGPILTDDTGNLEIKNSANTALTNISAANIVGNVVTGNLLTGVVTTASQPNITSVGTLTSLTVSGNTGLASTSLTNLTITGNGMVTGNIIPSANVTYNLGNSTNRFKDLYLSGNTIQLGDSTISTSGNGLALPSADVTTDLTVGGNATITGNLTVSGTTTYVNSTNTSIVDPIIELGGGANNASLTSNDGMDRGTILNYFTGNSSVKSFMGWKSGNSEFTLASNVSVTNNAITINSLGNLRANVVIANLTGNATTAGTVVTADQPNITSLGTLSNLFIGNGAISGPQYTVYSNGSAIFSNKVTTAYLQGELVSNSSAQPNITSLGTLTSLNVNGTSVLGAVGNVVITGGSNGQVLTTNGNGTLSWSSVSGGGSYGDSNVTALLTSGNIVGNIVFGNNSGTYANLEIKGTYSKIIAPYIEGSQQVSTRIVDATGIGSNQDLFLKSASNVTIQAFDGTSNNYANIVSVISNYPSYSSPPRIAINGNVTITGNISATNLGNISLINKDGNASNVLYGNGVFAAAPSGSGNVSTDYWRATSKTLTYSSSSTVSLLTLPANATVDKVTVIVDTAFNGSSPGATVGLSTGTGLEYVTTNDVNLKVADRYDMPCQIAPSGVTANVVISYTASSSTAGSARVIITYAVAS